VISAATAATGGKAVSLRRQGNHNVSILHGKAWPDRITRGAVAYLLSEREEGFSPAFAACREGRRGPSILKTAAKHRFARQMNMSAT
jgi:hypothetical protein